MEQPKVSDQDILRLPTIKCECGGIVFEAGVVFKKWSILTSPTRKEEKFPMNLMFCKSCGKIPAALYEPEAYILFPEELKTTKQ